MINRLTETSPFRDGETTASNCSRIAAACGYDSASAFAMTCGFSFKNLAEGNPADLDRFATKIDRTGAYVARGVVRSGSGIVSLAGERLLSRQMFRLSLRFCPTCLAEDENSGLGRRGSRGYGRMSWQVLSFRSCPFHHVQLVAPEYRATVRFNHDFTAQLRMMPQGLDWHQANARVMVPDGLQNYVEERLAGGRDGTLWPDQMPLYDVVALAEVLGAVQRHGVNYRSTLLDPDEWSRCAADGFDILKSGEVAFREFVYSLLARDYMPRKNATRRSLLGRLYDLLYFAVEDFDGIARAIIREAMAETDRAAVAAQDAGGAKKVTVSAAANRFGVDRLRLRKLLGEGSIISSEQVVEAPNRIVVDESVAERFADELKRTMDRKEARSFLGASPLVFNSLSTKGLLAPQMWSLGHKPGIYAATRFLVTEIEAILKRLHAAAKPEIGTDGMVSISVAVQEGGSSYREVLDFLIEGKLEKVALVVRGGGFQDIRLDVDEVSTKTVAADHGFMSVKAAASKIKVPARVVAALVKRGMLVTVRKRNPDTHRLADFLPPDAVDNFNAEFVTLNRLADSRNVSKPKLRLDLAPENLEPAFVILETPFYRWSEIPID